MCTHTAISPTRRYTRSCGDQVEGKRRRKEEGDEGGEEVRAHEREEKGSEENKRTPRRAERLARRAMIKIARSNRRAWCSFDVLYLSVILPSFPTPTGHGDIHAERTPLRYRDPPHTQTDVHTHVCPLAYNAGREMQRGRRGYVGERREEGGGEGGEEKMELTRVREQCTGASSPSPSCVTKRGCMILKDVHPTCTRERSLTLIDNYVSIFIT